MAAYPVSIAFGRHGPGLHTRFNSAGKEPKVPVLMTTSKKAAEVKLWQTSIERLVEAARKANSLYNGVSEKGEF